MQCKSEGGTCTCAMIARLTAVLLCVLFLCGAVSCTGATGDDPASDTAEGQTDADRFRGEALSVLSADTAYASDGTGSAVSRALYTLDGAIRDTLGITVSYETRSARFSEDRKALLTAVRRDVESGAGRYDLFRLPALTATEAALCGVLAALPDTAACDGLSYAVLSGDRMLGFGAFDPALIDTVSCIAVSESLLGAAGISVSALLETVADGGFTVEEMMRLGTEVSAQLGAEREVIPFAATDAQAVTMYYGAGFAAVDTAWKSTVHGDLRAEMPRTFFSTVTDWMRKSGCPENTLGISLFAEGRLLMMPIGMASLTLLADSLQSGAGLLVLPLPKWKTAQSGYRAPLSSDAPTYAVSAVTDHGALCAAVLSLAADRGTVAVTGAFFEALYGAPIGESDLRRTVLDIAVRSVQYDLGYTASDLLGGKAELLLQGCVRGGMSDMRYHEALLSLSDAIDALLKETEESEESDAISLPSS